MSALRPHPAPGWFTVTEAIPELDARPGDQLLAEFDREAQPGDWFVDPSCMEARRVRAHEAPRAGRIRYRCRDVQPLYELEAAEPG